MLILHLICFCIVLVLLFAFSLRYLFIYTVGCATRAECSSVDENTVVVNILLVEQILHKISNARAWCWRRM
jgi:hypothetical protein